MRKQNVVCRAKMKTVVTVPTFYGNVFVSFLRIQEGSEFQQVSVLYTITIGVNRCFSFRVISLPDCLHVPYTNIINGKNQVCFP